LADHLPCRRERDAIYRVRVTVLDPAQVPVEDAKVWSSMGGEPKKVAGDGSLTSRRPHGRPKAI
jgi:hypothetical protein